MQCDALQLVEFLAGPKQRFVIPVFQRNYDWKKKHCEQLYNDLIKVIQRKRKMHFLGSIVSISPGGHSKEFQIIDGQQRLTTTTILLLAMYNLINEGKIIPQDETLKDKIFEQYLVDPYSIKKNSVEKYVKLRPIKRDQVAFYNLFDDQTEHVKGSNITINYEYFYNRIQQEEKITIDELFAAIELLEIINITIDQDEDPQLVFESLNSTGLALSESDKVRNYLLMGLTATEQEDYYSKYWEKIENCTDDNLDNFIRDYLSIKQSSIPSKKDIYIEFKSYVEDQVLKLSPEEILLDLRKYARFYKILIGKEKINDNRIDACIFRLNHLETTIVRPFFLEVLRIQKEGRITLDETFQIFRFTENYLFRRLICVVATSALNNIFLRLHNEIVSLDGTLDNYLQKFKYILLSKQASGKFPEDKDFSLEFSTKPVYKMKPKNTSYIFERLENYGTSEDKDVYRHIEDGDYSIEHIMPQTLTAKWKEELGDNFEEIHETWKDRVANLTLTAYNSQYSNRIFAEKRDSKDGYRKSGIRMNQRIAQCEHWGETELKTRSQALTKAALKIWERPQTDYKPSKKELDYYTLEDNVNLTGQKIAKFAYKNAEQPARNWQDMYENVLRQLHSENPMILYKLSEQGESEELASYFSKTPSSLREAFEIAPDLYSERNTSTTLKQSVLRRLFKIFNIDLGDLRIYLQDDDPEKFLGSLFDRHFLRQEFWDHALPVIRNHNKNSGAFDKVYKSTDNYLRGAIGIKQFFLVAIANSTQARVALTFHNKDKETNKRAFDSLFKHKDEIEKELGVVLVWERDDDAKSSKIYYELNDVSITNQEDWDKMAEFQGIWCAKFYDKIVVPYLKPVFSKK